MRNDKFPFLKNIESREILIPLQIKECKIKEELILKLKEFNNHYSTWVISDKSFFLNKDSRQFKFVNIGLILPNGVTKEDIGLYFLRDNKHLRETENIFEKKNKNPQYKMGPLYCNMVCGNNLAIFRVVKK
jgi:hypothetical protein